MCGIAGIVTKAGVKDAFASLKKATGKLAHRGPQEENFWINSTKTVGFGHRRLCIIDLSKDASQPMHFEDRYTIIYNGEIYNYLEIREELEKRGHSFRSHSDTEVLLIAYAAWGPDCLQKLDGMFAFAIWDEKEQTLFAARDCFGEKPFFFFYDEEQFVFASEIKALWELGIGKEVNRGMLYNFLAIGYTTNPGNKTETFYDDIYNLPAAHYLTYSFAENKLQTHLYWQTYIDINEQISENDAIEEFKRLFSQSINRRLRSDVTIGTSLSGGLDSSAVVAFCAEESSAQYTHKCFTASFADFEKDETTFAALVANHFHLQHHTTTILPDEVAALMDKVAAQQDEPFSSGSVLVQYKIFELARENDVTVILDGQGADEIAAGYHKYYKWYWQELYRLRNLKSSSELKLAREIGIKEPWGIKNKLAAFLPEFSASILQSQKSKEAFHQGDLNRDFAFSNKRNLYYATPTDHNLNGALYYNTFVNGLEELLRFADRNSMAHSVEVRLPFLQRQLVEFLFTLPPHFKIHQGWTKWILRKAVESKLPASIAWRKDKVGYEPPQKLWMTNEGVKERMTMAKKTLVENQILSPHVINKKIIPKAAHQKNSFDWRYWSAAQLFNVH